MKQEPRAYQAYILRLWIMDNDGCPQWRLSLEDVHVDARVHFAGIASLIVYLLEEMERRSQPPTGGSDLGSS